MKKNKKSYRGGGGSALPPSSSPPTGERAAQGGTRLPHPGEADPARGDVGGARGGGDVDVSAGERAAAGECRGLSCRAASV